MPRTRTALCIATVVAMVFAARARGDVYRLVDDPRQAMQVRVDMIQQAKSEIDALYFLARNDRITWTALALLRDARRRGVRVRLIVDATFNHVPSAVLAHLHDEGVEVRVYHPFTLRHPSWIFRRMHDKVVVVDGQRYITGGRNLDEAYFGLNRKHNFRDRDVYVEGASGSEADLHFEKLWSSHHVADINADVSIRAKAKAAALLDAERSSLVNLGFIDFDTGTDWSSGQSHEPAVRFIHDPIDDGQGPRVAQSLTQIIETARQSILIESPYLIPSQSLIQLLGRKQDEGVTIRIITNSMKSTDGLLPQVAYLRYRHFLVTSGMELYEYKGPDTLHSKSVIVDGRIAMVGSYNVDPRSENLNTEIMCSADDAAAAKALLAAIDTDLRNSWKIPSNGRSPRSRGYPRVTRTMRFLIWTTQLLLPFIEGQL
ncbi:MAG: phosphatidylserine/phosphatidylglycerophosphate/cardiolipin synthase family protein [Acidobacteriota bacterium]